MMLKTQTHSHSSSRSQHAPKVAVVLNGNARAVNERLVADLRGLLQDETLFVSHSLEQSRFIARHLINQRFDVVLCGGGDGTFTQVVSDVAALSPQRLPAFGVLKLGTGNALATVLGAKAGLQGLAADLRTARNPEARRSLGMLTVEGRVSPFAGVGVDAMILEDYGATRRLLSRFIGKWSGGPLGYALAIGGRSTWRQLLEQRPEIIVRNEGAPAYRIDRQGRRIGRPIARKDVIYRGRPTIAAASTIPNYGFSLKLFPQADTLEGRFQLRISETAATTALMHLPSLFRGEFEDEKMWDYACNAISISAPDGTPLQVGGDLMGRRNEIHMGYRQLEGACGSDATFSPRPASDSALVASAG
jgi:diacylglycerol kinase family enzyme